MTEQRQHKEAMRCAHDWELGLEAIYTEDEIVTIMNFLSYYDNAERGFGHRNDERLYQSERREDVDGKLHEEALKGFELHKRCNQLRYWVTR